MDCVTGRSAIIDLSNKMVAVETISDDDVRKFLGGNGLAINTFLDKMRPGVDAFSPENIPFFGTGPMTGTGIQGSDRTYIAAKSPLTGLFFDSTMGGRFASSLKQTGYDAITIVGKANEPSYILVDGAGIEIRDACELVGKSPEEVRSILSTRLKDFEVCSIGIAGENLVKYASIIHRRASGRQGVAGRGGLGAVMGSKNLKAIAVQRGKENKVSVYSDALLRDVKDRIQNNLTGARGTQLTLVGTAGGVERINALGGLGTRNLTDETFESAGEIGGEKLKDNYFKRNITCHSCPVACGKLCELDGKLAKSPEYETIYALGSMVGIGDLEAIIRANILCNRYGLDTMSMGVTIAFAIECFEKGLLSLQQSGGRHLKFGDPGLLLDLIEETAYRRGFGGLLAEGTKHMSEILGGDSCKYAYQVKGLELAGHSPRVLKVMSIGYATNTRGGSHQGARVRYGPDMDTYEGKVEQAIATQHLSAVGDSLVQCRFVMEAGLGVDIIDEISNLLKAVTGWGPSTHELNEIGERIVNMERIFNIREGVSRKDDTLPHKVMYEEIPQGPHKGQRTSPEKLEELLDSYYNLRGWDENGIPQVQTLKRLGLKEYFTD